MFRLIAPYPNMLKRKLVSVLTLVTLLGAVTFPQSNASAASIYAKDMPFLDIPATFWGSANIQWAVENQIVEGYADGTFKPNRHVEQAEFLAMLIRAYQPAAFTSDPKAADWTVPFISFAAKIGWEVITPSSLDGHTSSVYLTRGKVSQYLANAAGKKLTTVQSIEYLLGLGIIEGKTAKSVEGYQKDDEVTRAEAVTLIQRFKLKQDRLLPIESDQPKPNEFDPRKAKVGDVVAGWKITSLDTKLWENGELMSAIVEFENKEIEVNGTYQNLLDDSEFFNGIVFTLDEASEKLIPKIKAGGQSTGNRIIFRSPEAEASFLPQGSTGRAKIMISGFSFHYWPKDDYRDNTKFVKLVEIEKSAN